MSADVKVFAAVRKKPRKNSFFLTVRTLLLLGVFVGGISCSDASDSRVMLQGDGRPVPVTVEFALTPASQARGLMWRDELPADHGMLFVFSDSRPRSFWMKNTPLPLDIIYIGEDARIVSIAARTTPYSTRSIPSSGPAKYVLEVNGGFCEEHGVTAGSQVVLPKIPPKPAASRTAP